MDLLLGRNRKLGHITFSIQKIKFIFSFFLLIMWYSVFRVCRKYTQFTFDIFYTFLESAHKRFGDTVFFFRDRRSGSRRFRSWNSLFVRCLHLLPPVSCSSLLLLGDDVSRNVYVVASWHGLTAFTRPRQPVPPATARSRVHVHSRLFFFFFHTWREYYCKN